ncbi:MAG TPA: Uma2 family endonuclease [Saprospiraceae bacterium]|nr:Uma2 family endonuclease [Saprospiraceae bacterium]HRJ16843.1 Uma2 family endonuclease [Saprospiraceae bacterium]HRK82390.1 Uma2 family endonuclease [Saprospiraceae bacterium]
MPAVIAKKRFTVADYHKMAEAGVLPERGVELINGEIIEMSPVGSKHLFCVNALTELLTLKLAGKFIVSVQNPVRLSNFSEPEPDLAVLQRVDNRYADRLPAAKDALLLIEVADSSYVYDREVKLPAYAQSGIPECWIVNLEAQELEVFWLPVGDAYQHNKVWRAGDVVRAQYFELELAVGEILPGS